MIRKVGPAHGSALTGVLLAACVDATSGAGGVRMLDELVTASAARKTWIQASFSLEGAPLNPSERDRARVFIEANPYARAYLPLLALRTQALDRYRAIPAATRAAVLCAALRELRYLNDWGHLDADPPGEAMQALIEAGPAALPCLLAELGDRRPAPFFGSEDATLSIDYRRADFAYRGATAILGEPRAFDRDTAVRDRRIAELERRLSALPAP